MSRFRATLRTGEVQEPAKPEKALVTAEEQIRVLKLVVANSKKEIAYYNQVWHEKRGMGLSPGA